MATYRSAFLLITFLLAALAGCEMKKDVDLVLPDYNHQMVVECYLEDGKPVRLLLTETSAYFDSPVPRGIENATVTFTKNGTTDTLTELTNLFQQIDTLTRKAANYALMQPLQAQPGDDFALMVKDPQGRTLTGTSKFMTPVPIDTVRFYFRGDTIASLYAYFQDPPGQQNYYRFMVHRNTPLGNREDDDLGSDRLIEGLVGSFNTKYNFRHGDTVVVTLYHLEKQYYEFLRTVRDAKEANGNPFAQPATIRSTVSGGMGIFTNLSYFRKTLIVP